MPFDKLLTKLPFINEHLIPESTRQKAERTVANIDIDDVHFVALTKYVKGGLWTGDKPLYEGLKAKRFRTVHNTAGMIALRNQLLKIVVCRQKCCFTKTNAIATLRVCSFLFA